MKQFLILVASIYLVGIIFFVTIFNYQLKPLLVSADLKNKTAEFIVQKGEGFKEIAENLEAQKLIKSSKSFKLYLLLHGWANKLKPGIYQIPYELPAKEIAKILLAGVIDEKTITIPEGYTLSMIEEKLKNEGILASDESLSKLKISDFQNDYFFFKDAPSNASLEGFLFPDTYRFKINSPAKIIAKRMLDNLEKNLSDGIRQQIEQSRFSLYEIITLASLIEGEIPHAEDRPIVAGILIKRLDNQIPLQVDASIVYIKCEILKTENCRKLSLDDLKIPSPYNTYLNLKLPKGPINNPGLNAIEAALNPLEGPYWYYLSDPKTGNTIFSKTLKEHDAAKARYLK